VGDSGSEGLMEKLSERYGDAPVRRPSLPPGKLSDAREALLGREKELIQAVDKYGLRRVAELLSADGISISRNTLSRMCAEIRKTGAFKTGDGQSPSTLVARDSDGRASLVSGSQDTKDGNSEEDDGGVGVSVYGSNNVKESVEVNGQSGKTREEVSREILDGIMKDSFRRNK